MKINIVVISYKLNFLAESLISDLDSSSDLYIIHVGKTKNQISNFICNDKAKKIFIYNSEEEKKSHWKVLESVFDGDFPEILDCDFILFLDHDLRYSNIDVIIDRLKEILSQDENKDIWSVYDSNQTYLYDWGFATVPFFLVNPNSPYRDNSLGSWSPKIVNKQFRDTGRIIASKIKSHVLPLDYSHEFPDFEYHFTSYWSFFECHRRQYDIGNRLGREIKLMTAYDSIRENYYNLMSKIKFEIQECDIEIMKNLDLITKYIYRENKHMLLKESETVKNAFPTEERFIQFAIDNLSVESLAIKKGSVKHTLLSCEERKVVPEDIKGRYDLIVWDGASSREICNFFIKNLSSKGVLVQKYIDSMDYTDILENGISVTLISFDDELFCFFTKNLYTISKIKKLKTKNIDIKDFIESNKISSISEYTDFLLKISSRNIEYSNNPSTGSLISKNLIFNSKNLSFLKINDSKCRSTIILGPNIEEKRKILNTVYKSFDYSDYIERIFDNHLPKDNTFVVDSCGTNYILIDSDVFIDIRSILFDSETDYEIARDNLIGSPVFFSNLILEEFVVSFNFYKNNVIPSSVEVFFSKESFNYNQINFFKNLENKSVSEVTLYNEKLPIVALANKKIHHIECWDLIKGMISKEKQVWDTPCCFEQFHFLLDDKNIEAKNMGLINFDIDEIKKISGDSIIYHSCIPSENKEKFDLIKSFFDSCSVNNIENVYYIQLPFIMSIEDSFSAYNSSFMQYSHKIEAINFFGENKSDYVIVFKRRVS